MPPSLASTLLQLDFSRVFELTFLIVIFSFLIIDQLIGVTHRAGLLEMDGNVPRMWQALIAESFAATFGSLIGTSTTTNSIERGAGGSAGGRTGLTAVFVAMLFLLALFFSPLAGLGAGLSLCGGAPLCRLRDEAGACRTRLGPNMTGRRCLRCDAAHLFDRARHRAPVSSPNSLAKIVGKVFETKLMVLALAVLVAIKLAVMG